MVYSEWVRRKQSEVLNWQINKPNDDDDGGFCAEKPHDVGGVWTTAETLFILLKYKLLPPQDSRIQRAKNWLLRHQNLGGDYGDGWPLINRGNSFVDTTARAVLALSFFAGEIEVKEAIRRAKDWLLENQNEDGGWSIWKYEDSLVSATSFVLVALRQLVDLFPDDQNAKLATLNGAAWLKAAQNPSTGLWGFEPNGRLAESETNNASTRMAVYALFMLGEDLEEYLPALKSFIAEFEAEGRWRTIPETYTLKYFGEGLDQRLSWFNAPFMVMMLVTYARCVPGCVGIKPIIDGAESLKKFDAVYQGMEVTDISVGGNLDIRPWASVQYLRGLLEAESYLQDHLDEYVEVMGKKVAVIEKAGMLKSMPILMPHKRTSSVYASGKFYIMLVPLLGLSLIGIAYLTAHVGFEVSAIVGLFAVYIVTFGILLTGFKQKVISKSKFCFMYFPIWALAVAGTVLLFLGEHIEGLVVLLLIGFPELLSLVMNKLGKEEHDNKE
ncbi:MAG: terpene cyclase/mutase family protein [Candidatus Bathyarchaeota archaeon]|nr:terpene cyclase/mutase family protein [Candidatus Bathyarchaeota archaeon]